MTGPCRQALRDMRLLLLLETHLATTSTQPNLLHMNDMITRPGTEFSNIRLVSTRAAWRWVGAVHEYVERTDGRDTSKVVIRGCHTTVGARHI
jgi:hypothetical protein